MWQHEASCPRGAGCGLRLWLAAQAAPHTQPAVGSLVSNASRGAAFFMRCMRLLSLKTAPRSRKRGRKSSFGGSQRGLRQLQFPPTCSDSVRIALGTLETARTYGNQQKQGHEQGRIRVSTNTTRGETLA